MLESITSLAIIALLIYTCRNKVRKIIEQDKVDEYEYKRKIAERSGDGRK